MYTTQKVWITNLLRNWNFCKYLAEFIVIGFLLIYFASILTNWNYLDDVVFNQYSLLLPQCPITHASDKEYLICKVMNF